MKKPKVQIITDGRTVWVNSPEICIGRFGPNGVDVHHDAAGQMAGHHCLDCRVEPDWKGFQASMLEHHGVVVGDRYKPLWVYGFLQKQGRSIGGGRFRHPFWARTTGVTQGVVAMVPSVPVLKWKRPVLVWGHMERVSHCGRYKIEKRTYDIPCKSVAYCVYRVHPGGIKGGLIARTRELSFARQAAQSNIKHEWKVLFGDEAVQG